MVAIILNHPVIFGMCIVGFVALCAAASIVVELAHSAGNNDPPKHRTKTRPY